MVKIKRFLAKFRTGNFLKENMAYFAVVLFGTPMSACISKRVLERGKEGVVIAERGNGVLDHFH
jgi:hypothetical protein